MLTTDSCDLSPVTEGFSGFNINNGDTLKKQGNNGTVQLRINIIELKTTTKHTSNHHNKKPAALLVTP